MSRSAHKQQRRANITVALLAGARRNYIMLRALTSRERATVLCDTTPLALRVSWRRYGPHNLIRSFCHVAKRRVALAERYRP